MKKIFSISTIVMLALVLGIGSVSPVLPQAHAEDWPCMEDIESVRDILNNGDVTIQGGNPGKTLNSLNLKLDGADDKLQDGKFDKAYQKLDQFENKVIDLDKPNTKGLKKIIGGDVDDLLAAIADAKVCVNALT